MNEHDIEYIVDKYTQIDNCFNPEYVQTLKQSILNSGYLTKNHLNSNFSSTLGFSVIFKKEHTDKVINKFPYLEKFLEKIIEEPYNTFYLNPLVLPLKGKVDKHIDHSLRSYYLKIDFPERVVVYYVDIPEMSGGNLILYKEDKFIAKIRPSNNKLVLFKGNLKHEITTITDMSNISDSKRMSLVCEQYNLDKYSLSQVPDFLVRSDADFNTFLADEIQE